MKAGNLKFNLTDGFFWFLNKLSPTTKRELISKLSDSLKDPSKRSSGTWRDLYGAFISEKSADEIIGDIKSARSFNRKTEEF